MHSTDREHPLVLDVDRIGGIRKVLHEAHFNERGILEHLNQEDSVRVEQKEFPRLLRMTAGGAPVDVLIRLFILNVPVEMSWARRAVAPMTIDSWLETGLLRREGERIHAVFRLVPSGPCWIAFDPTRKETHQEMRPDHVHGPGPSSIRLLHAAVRRRAGWVLDMGTGCGIQGIMCASHSERVISTDVNPRALNIAAFNAALNNVWNMEFRRGSLFEPVETDRFDTILVNPPFAISPESRFAFRDGGMAGDGFVERIIRDAPRFLNEGGLCQLTAQWAHIRGTPWQHRLQRWFQESGCDVWVLNLTTQSPAAYAVNWLTETEKLDPSAYASRWEKWIEYYERRHIEAISTGLINMRKTNRPPQWHRFEEDVEQIDEDAGRCIERGFEWRDFAVSASNDTLLKTAFLISEDACLRQRSRSSGDGWSIEHLVLGMTRGICYTGNVDGRMIGLLGRCNGKRPMGELIEELAAALEVDSERIMASVLGIIRQLGERGVIIPKHLL